MQPTGSSIALLRWTLRRYANSRQFTRKAIVLDNTNTKPTPQSASDQLFADAAREEAEAAATPQKHSRITLLENQHENWTGDERIQDAVLRMLVDKYKPLRTGAIQSAELKLKQTPPKVASSQILLRERLSSTATPIVPSTGSWATESLLPSKEGHQPWHTQFKAPSHVTSSVKIANFPPISTRPAVTPPDERARKRERETQKRMEHGVRLTRARESTLDYRLGMKSDSGRPLAGGPNPVSLKGWTSLIEDKIEKARKAGLFQNVKGRGQPMVRNMEESNPFIAREEYLMNRIVQRNGAAPPWVEVQGELDTAINTFREILRQSWVRRALRNLTVVHPAALLHTLSLDDVKALRDPDWERREQSYHETAIEEINGLVRKYNALAPYAVRRPFYTRSVEVEKLYIECAGDILRALEERARELEAGGLRGNTRSVGSSSSNQKRNESVVKPFAPLRIRDIIRGWLEKITTRWRAG